ncbi:hypothetical protein Bhyg_12347, partial [Pseudolycoriella hygida]
LGKDDLIDAEKFVWFLKVAKKFDDSTLDQMEVITNTCKGHKHLSEDKCETVANFVKCCSEEARKVDLDPRIMTQAIRSPFFARPHQYRLPPPIEQKIKGEFLFDWPGIEFWQGLVEKVGK